jgi:hypothetical protein
MSAPTKQSSSRPKRFLTELISIGVGSAALAISTYNTIQTLKLQQEIKAVTDSLSILTNTANLQTTQLFHLQQGQLRLAQELNYTQIAFNSTIALVNNHSDILTEHTQAIESLRHFAQYLSTKLTAFINSVESHFLRTSLADILAHKLNLNFIHHNDLPTVLDFVIAATNVSFNLQSMSLPLVDLVSTLLAEQHLHFVPNPVPPNSRGHVLGVLSISSFFAATTPDQISFSLYQLLPIPFSYNGLRVRLADIPFIIGLDANTNHLIRWTESESTTCDFRVMSICRETPPIINDWTHTCLFQILTDTTLSACRAEQYLEPLFIHRIGTHWAISTNSTNECHLTSHSILDQSYAITDNIRVLPPVALITIPNNMTLVCDRFSISSLPILSSPSLTILDSTIINTSTSDIFDLSLPLSNTTRWEKLPYIPAHLQAVLDFITNTTGPSLLPPVSQWYTNPFSYTNFILMLIIVVLFLSLLYCRFIRPTPIPQVHLELPSIS